MLVNLSRPDYLGLEMAKDVFLNCELHHLSRLAHRALSNFFGAANFQKLCAAIAPSWNHSQVLSALKSVVLRIALATRRHQVPIQVLDADSSLFLNAIVVRFAKVLS